MVLPWEKLGNLWDTHSRTAMVPGKCLYLHAGGAIHARPYVPPGQYWGILDAE